MGTYQVGAQVNVKSLSFHQETITFKAEALRQALKLIQFKSPGVGVR